MIAKTSFEKGLEQGIEQGIERGQRTLLERQLTRRFGPLSETVRQRLASWPAERLTQLSDTLFEAASLQELGLED